MTEQHSSSTRNYGVDVEQIEKLLSSECQELTNVCSAYSADSLASTHSAVESFNCGANPSEATSSSRKWYYLNPIPHAESNSCKHIKNAKPSSSNGYYTIQIRGNDIRVYCRMTVQSSYIDLVAESRHSGSGGGSIPTPVTYYFTRARLSRGNCLIVLVTSDYVYATTTGPASEWQPKASVNGIGRGKACPGSDFTGKTEIDLTGSQFRIPAWVQFEYQQGNPRIVTESRTAQKLKLIVEGRGGDCSFGKIFVNESGKVKHFTEKIPLQLHWP
ncbi:uncharacterized protein LOC142346254 [Convolutriloba macropyga]|uniref:uncharacterized protein LOC142346254 n=1 Tax=Convolutriloba macropyga TaxID=536237 RepID=UPI003F51B833